MKAILNLDGFTKIIDISSPTVLITQKLTMDEQTVDVPFVRLGSEKVDGEEVYLYKVLEPNRDMTNT